MEPNQTKTTKGSIERIAKFLLDICLSEGSEAGQQAVQSFPFTLRCAGLKPVKVLRSDLSAENGGRMKISVASLRSSGDCPVWGFTSFDTLSKPWIEP